MESYNIVGFVIKSLILVYGGYALYLVLFNNEDKMALFTYYLGEIAMLLFLLTDIVLLYFRNSIVVLISMFCQYICYLPLIWDPSLILKTTQMEVFILIIVSIISVSFHFICIKRFLNRKTNV
jgi:hypothetical protein